MHVQTLHRHPVPARYPLALALVLLLAVIAPLAPVARPLPAARTSGPAAPAGAGASAPPLAAPRQAAALGDLPLDFVPNLGQFAPGVMFQARAAGLMAAFTQDGMTVTLPRAGDAPSADDPIAEQDDPPVTETRPATLRLEFDGANPDAELLGGEQRPGVYNYFVGDDPATWRSGVRAHAEITYRQLYPGIDLRYDGGSENRLKGTYTVAPGADPGRIGWRYQGAAGVRIHPATGDLRIALSDGSADEAAEFTEAAPVAWQEIGDRRVRVSVAYAIAEDGRIGFSVEGYDPAYQLTIDPLLIFEKGLQGYASRAIAIQPGEDPGSTSMFVAGNVFEPENLGTGEDAFVLKIDARGIAVYHTFVGGGLEDVARGIAVDQAGNAYIAGETRSPDFTGHLNNPGRLNYLSGDQDAFVAKLDVEGKPVFGAYVGGSRSEQAFGIGVDRNGTATIAGDTVSGDFPHKNEVQPRTGKTPDQTAGSDAFVARLTSDGTDLIYSTTVGGPGAEMGRAITVDGNGNAYVAGIADERVQLTSTTPSHPLGDAFVLKLTNSGALGYFAYIGDSSGGFAATGIAVDAQGSAFVAGITFSVENAGPDTFASAGAFQPVRPGGFSDGFVVKMDPTGGVAYATYLGGTRAELLNDIAIDSDGSAYVTGRTNSSDYPTTTTPTFQVYAGSESPFYNVINGDAVITVLKPGGSGLRFSTYYGGKLSDDGHAIAVNRATREIFVTGALDDGRFGYFTHFSGPQTLRVRNLVANQAVDDPDAELDYVPDLVADRNTLFRVDVEVAEEMLDTDTIEVSLEIVATEGRGISPGPPAETRLALEPQTFTAKKLRERSFVDFFATPARRYSNFQVTASLAYTAAQEPITKAAKLTRTRDYFVKAVRPIRYAFVNVQYGGAALDQATFQQAAQRTHEYLKGVLPVGDGPADFTYVLHPGPVVVRGACPPKGGGRTLDEGAADDAKTVWKAAKSRAGTIESVVALVPQGWLRCHDLDDRGGLRVPNTAVAFADSDIANFNDITYGNIAAHELGHVYGLDHTYERYPPIGPRASGYWVSKKIDIPYEYAGIPDDAKVAYDTMGASFSHRDENGVEYQGQSWPTKRTFSLMFKAFLPTAKPPPTGGTQNRLVALSVAPVPESAVLLLTGMIATDGTVTLDPVHRITDGRADYPPPGEAAMQILDAAGNVLAVIPFILDFTYQPEMAPPVLVDRVPFAIAVPYPDGAAQVRIVRGETVLALQRLTDRLLRDAIMSIPDEAFAADPAGRRQALLGRADTLGQQLAVENLAGARATLEAIRAELVAWLRDDYVLDDPLRHTKLPMLELVDELLLRVPGLTATPAPGRPGAPTVTAGPPAQGADPAPGFAWSPAPGGEGLAFAPPITISPGNVGTDSSGRGGGPPIVADGAQVWAAYAVHSTFPGQFGLYPRDIFLARSPDRGATFPNTWRINLPDTVSQHRSPSLARHGNAVHVAWSQYNESARVSTVQFASKLDGSDEFSTRTVVAALAGNRTSIAVDGQGVIYIAFDVGSGGASSQTYIARSTDGGASFTVQSLGVGGYSSVVIAPGNRVVVANDRLVLWTSSDGLTYSSRGLGLGAAMGVALAVDQGGTLYLAWNNNPGTCCRFSVAASADGGQTFRTPVVLSTAQAGFNGFGLAGGAAGQVYVSWALTFNSSGGLYGAFARSSDGGATFSIPETLFLAGYEPVPAADPATGDVYLRAYSSYEHNTGIIKIWRGSVPPRQGSTFQWQVAGGGAGGGMVVAADRTTGQAASIPRLDDGDYTFRVREVDAGGRVGDWSAPWPFAIDTNRPAGAPVNAPPVAQDGAVTRREGGPQFSIDLGALASDTETPDDGLTFTIVAPPGKGTITLNGTLAVYRPGPGATGIDSFAYEVTDRGAPDNCATPGATCDGPAGSEQGIVTITFEPVTGPGPVPGAPTQVAATPGDGRATISWRAPAGGAPVERYEVRVAALAELGEGTSPPAAIVEVADPTQAAFTVVLDGLDGGATYVVTVSAASAAGTGPSAPAIVTLGLPETNAPPGADAGGPYTVPEGGMVPLAATGTDPDGDALSFAWDLDGDGTFEAAGQGVTFSAAALDGPTTRVVAVRVTDAGGLAATAQATIAVTNAAPTVAITGPPAGTLVAVGTPLTFAGTYSDPGATDTHVARWAFGGVERPAFAVSNGGAGTSFAFATPGVYKVTLTVADDDGGAGTANTVGGREAYVVAYDPAGGSITGGGWINSPAGACRLTSACAGAAGRVNFGFVLKYHKGAAKPDGETEFQFKAGGINFHSTGYDWLVVAGARAQFRGSGTINGTGDYAFLLTAVDGQGNGGGGVDRFRIKIWDKATGAVVYDNQMGASDEAAPSTAIGGGSIVIHAK